MVDSAAGGDHAKLPKIKLNKVWVIGGGVGAVAIWFAYRKLGGSKLSPGAATGTAVDTSATVDPTTGLPYADDSGYSSALGGATGSPWGSLSGLTYNPATGQYEAAGGSTATPTADSSNVQWGQAVENYLAGLGYNATSVNLALGKWFTGAGLSDSEYQIVQAAIGAQGNPPVTVPSPILAAPTGQTNTQKIAQTLWSPTASAGLQYIRQGDKTKPLYGWIGQVESDGSILGLTGAQWAALLKVDPGAASRVQNVSGVTNLQSFSTAGNITSNPGAAKPVPVPKVPLPAQMQ